VPNKQTTFYLSCGDTLHIIFDGAHLIVQSSAYSGQPLVGVFNKESTMNKLFVSDMIDLLPLTDLLDKKQAKTLCK